MKIIEKILFSSFVKLKNYLKNNYQTCAIFVLFQIYRVEIRQEVLPLHQILDRTSLKNQLMDLNNRKIFFINKI